MEKYTDTFQKEDHLNHELYAIAIPLVSNRFFAMGTLTQILKLILRTSFHRPPADESISCDLSSKNTLPIAIGLRSNQDLNSNNLN